jgi:hypothetical protein
MLNCADYSIHSKGVKAIEVDLSRVWTVKDIEDMVTEFSKQESRSSEIHLGE